MYIYMLKIYKGVIAYKNNPIGGYIIREFLRYTFKLRCIGTSVS